MVEMGVILRKFCVKKLRAGVAKKNKSSWICSYIQYILIIHISVYIYRYLLDIYIYIIYTSKVFSNLFHVFLICFLIKISESKKTSTERTHPKPSQVICTRSSDTAGEAVSFANSHDRFSPNRGFQKLYVFFSDMFASGEPSLFLFSFRKPESPKFTDLFPLDFPFP